jgi:hypothetical protein
MTHAIETECQHAIEDHTLLSETATWGLFSTVALARCNRCGTVSRLGWLVSCEYQGEDGPELENIACMPERGEAEHIGQQYGRPVVYHQITMKGRKYWTGDVWP